MIQKFNIINTGKLAFSFRLLLALFMPFLLFAYRMPGGLNAVVFAAIYLGSFCLVFRLCRSFFERRIQITMDKEQITIHAGKFLHKSESRLELAWDQIDEYIFQKEQYFDVVKLKMKNGGKFQISHDTDSKDDFDLFQKAFINYVTSNEIHARKGKTIYETRLGLMIAWSLVVLMVLLPLAIWLAEKDFNLGTMLVFYSGGIFFLYRFYLVKRK
ncbi:hypothetical protein QNI16_35880 [Cytophagaceae bacterium YF14B1]|uniref:YcxB-like protein domain-containing protein n=1 Tax=Xanthocytophaga flava TaxID=3048013 RepID=A0AAE3QV00_9BACT|nr:hypothetical protein [Xanthocytophaga flavus]MDJ1485917.1 hypothetical protein [Xanthocytophaga flavus]